MVLRRVGYTVGSQLLRRRVSRWVPVALIDFYKVVRERERERGNERRWEILFTQYLKGKICDICTFSRLFKKREKRTKTYCKCVCTSMYSWVLVLQLTT